MGELTVGKTTSRRNDCGSCKIYRIQIDYNTSGDRHVRSYVELNLDKLRRGRSLTWQFVKRHRTAAETSTVLREAQTNESLAPPTANSQRAL